VSKEHVLIIGASSSIGCEVIRQIAHDNMVILAQFHANADRLGELAKEVSAPIIPLQADFQSEADIETMLGTIEDKCPFPEKLVFLAAPKVALIRFKEAAWSDFQTQLDIQLRAAMLVCGRFLPKMAAAKTGKLVFVLSSCTLNLPPAAMAHYVTAKYAMLGLMKALASEYAAKKICINAVSPSMVETGFLSNFPDKLVELTADQHPLKRNAVPKDVAPMIKFLLSDDADYITGVNVPITGGSA
jgi:3-oxoacyl-[acyl-carrier protein] reductase